MDYDAASAKVGAAALRQLKHPDVTRAAAAFHTGGSATYVRGGDWHLWLAIAVIAAATAATLAIAVLGYQRELASSHRFDAVTARSVRVGNGNAATFLAHGSVAITGSVAAGSTATSAVQFDASYLPATSPNVVASLDASAVTAPPTLTAYATNVTKTGFTVVIYNPSDTDVSESKLRVSWIAML